MSTSTSTEPGTKTPDGLRVIKLVMVTQENNNKFYNMTETSGGMIEIVRGRVGQTDIKEKPVPARQWDSVVRSKLKKGYKDVTHLYAVESSSGPKVKDTLAGVSSEAAKMIEVLRKYAKASVESNYTISSDKVTQAQVDHAQELVDQLNAEIKSGRKSREEINEHLVKLYTAIPRKMKHVSDHLVKSDSKTIKKDAEKILADEQEILDVMAGQVATTVKVKTSSGDKKEVNLLESLGLKFEDIKSSDIEKIKKLMQDKHHKFHRAFKVVNEKTQTEFDKHLGKSTNQKTELFWHGSRNENWWSIVQSGLLIRPATAVHTGSMFGDGIYFANKFQKSLGYTSHRGSRWAGGSSDQAFLALYRVHVGEQWKVKHHQHSFYSLSHSKLKKDGYDSLHALGGADLINDEFVVYHSAQCTIEFIVEVK